MLRKQFKKKSKVSRKKIYCNEDRSDIEKKRKETWFLTVKNTFSI